MAEKTLLWLLISSADENVWHGAFSTYGDTFDYVEADKNLTPTSNIFKTKSGKLKPQGARTLLLNSALKQIGILEGIDATKDNPLGKNGQGRSDETGTAFNWTVSKFGGLVEAGKKPTTEMMLEALPTP